MLQSIREHAQGWIAWFIVILICSTFALWGVHNYIGGGRSEGIAAKINGQPISIQEVRKTTEQLKRSQQAQNSAVNPMAVEAALRKQALEQLINFQILAQAALQEGYRNSQQQIDALIMSLPAFQSNNRFSVQRFQQVIANLNMSSQEFLEQLNSQLLIDQARSAYVMTEFALPDEIKRTVALLGQTRDFNYLLISAKTFAEKVTISASDEQHYYQQHQAEFMAPEQVKVDYLALSLGDLTQKLTFTDQQLQDYYNNNRDNFRDPASWRVAQILIKVPANANAEQIKQSQQQAQQIYQRAKKGENFGKLAQHYSADLISAKKGGDIGWISENTLGPAFAKALAQLKKPGEISTPIRTQYGYNIVELQELKPAVTKSFVEVKPQIRQLLAAERAQQQFAEANDRLADLTYSNSDTLSIAAKALNLPIKTTDFFSRNGGTDALTKNPKLIAAAFNDDVLTQGYNSSPIQVSDDLVVVVRLNKHLNAVLRPFAEVKTQIHDKLLQKQTTELAQTLGKQLLQDLPQAQNAQAILNQNKLSWRLVNDLTRSDTKLNLQMTTRAFSLAAPVNNQPTWGGLSLTNGDYAIIKLTAVHDGKITSNTAAAEQAKYRKQIEDRLGAFDYQLYLQSLKKKAHIVIEKQSS